MTSLELKGKLIINGGLDLQAIDTSTQQIYHINGDHYKCNMGNYVYHVFTQSGTFEITEDLKTGIDYFVVGGGGNTAFRQQATGGGGAGGVCFNDGPPIQLEKGQYLVSLDSNAETAIYQGGKSPVYYIVAGAGGEGGAKDGYDCPSPNTGKIQTAIGCGGGGQRDGGTGFTNGGGGIGNAREAGGGGGYRSIGRTATITGIGAGGGSGIDIRSIFTDITGGVIGSITVGQDGWFAGGGGGYGETIYGTAGTGGGGGGSVSPMLPPRQAMQNTGGGAIGARRETHIGGSGIVILRYSIN